MRKIVNNILAQVLLATTFMFAACGTDVELCEKTEHPHSGHVSFIYKWGAYTDLPDSMYLVAYRSANSTYVELYDTATGPVANHKVAVPSGASSWYIPSYKEMQLIHRNKSVINTALANAGGTKIEGSLYWLSTLRTYNSYNDCQGSPFDMVNGVWYAYDKKTTSYPVRVVFAF